MKAYFSLIWKFRSRQFKASMEMTSRSLLWPSLICDFYPQGHKMVAGAPARMSMFQAERRKRGNGQRLFLPFGSAP